MESDCRIELFGGLRLVRFGEAVTRFPSQKARHLLAYLALSLGQTPSREQLMDLLWPEMEADAGRNNLSTHLSFLRRVLEPAGTSAGSVLRADRQSVSLNAASVQVDVHEFEAALRAARRETDLHARLTPLSIALALSASPLLPSFYDEWAIGAQTRTAAQRTAALLERAELLLEEERLQEAQQDAEALLESDPCDERACRLLMKASAMQGLREAALKAYGRLETALCSEFGASPHPETVSLKEAVRQSNANVLRCAEVQARPSVLTKKTPAATLPSPSAPSSLLPFSAASPDDAASLPKPLAKFFGREEEQKKLEDFLLDGSTRLVTILGAGGAGKTRLALEVARRISPQFSGRVWFVSLADIPAPSLIPMLLRNALHLSASQADPLQAVFTKLQEAPSLLVLDNMEHLLSDEETKAENPLGAGGRSVIRRLLESAPGLKCLVTSRQTLRLEGEQVFVLPPLALPENVGLDPASACASVALYVDRAQKAKADFLLTSHNTEAVISLCRRLEGMPLAIEMAAAWIKTLPPARMLEKLEDQLRILVSRRKDLPARQQSLRAACEWSCEQLSDELRAAFVKLSVFRGGWTLEAAEAVLGEETPFLIEELQERSLIFQAAHSLQTPEAEGEERMRMLEPLREFGLEKLEESGLTENAGKLHARFFSTLAEKAKEAYHTPQERCHLACLKRDEDNLREALRWSVRNDPPLALKLAANLCRFWELNGGLREGDDWLKTVLALPEAQGLSEERARAFQGAGVLAQLRADYPAAEVYYRQALRISQEGCGWKGQASALQGLGNAAFYEQHFSLAREFYTQSLDIREALEDELGIAASCHSLGNVEMREENFGAAQGFFERALSLRHKNGNEIASAYSLGALGQLARQRGRDEDALEYVRETLQRFHGAQVFWAVALSLKDLANLAWKRGQVAEAVTIEGAVATLREATGYLTPPAERPAQRAYLEELREQIGEADYRCAWETGVRMDEPQAVAYALRVVGAAESAQLTEAGARSEA